MRTPEGLRWADVSGYEGLYQVSSDGRVRSLDRVVEMPNRHGSMTKRRHKGRELRQWVHPRGYVYVSLAEGGRKENRTVHSLVALHFLEGTGEVNHKDMDKTNNDASNLEWTTRQENVSHFMASGQHHAVNNPNMARKLTRAKVRAIRERRDLGLQLKELAEAYGVSVATVSNVCAGKTWRGA